MDFIVEDYNWVKTILKRIDIKSLRDEELITFHILDTGINMYYEVKTTRELKMLER